MKRFHKDINFMTYLFCAYRDWALELYKKLSKKYRNVVLIRSPKQLKIQNVKKINPKFIFFPDWSWIVPTEIVNNFTCICFHESNLPKFRGGSPLQNQIIRGIKSTKTTAFQMTDELDKGDILLQHNLSLEGSLEEIFDRMIKNDYAMITKIVNGKYKKRKQKGHPTYYARRKHSQSELKNLNFSKQYLYDFIRMLEDPYPNAFLKSDKKRIVFKSVKYDGKHLKFEGEII